MTNDYLYEALSKQESIYKGKYLNVERLFLRQPNGKEAVREIVCVKDAVAVLPVDSDGKVHLIRQHRAAIARTLIEVPAGLVDKDETPQHCARRECEEETGFIPRKLHKLITYAHAEGYSTGFITLFLGTNLQHTGKTHLDETEHVEQINMVYEELMKMIFANEIWDSKTILSAILSKKLIYKEQARH